MKDTKLIKRIAQLKDTGLNATQIGIALDLSPSQVAAYLAHHTRAGNGERNSSRARPDDSNKTRGRVIALRDRGMNSDQIARQLRITKTSVAAYLAHYTRGSYRD